MLQWGRDTVVGAALLATLVSGCGFKKAESPSDLALAKAKQLQSANSHILAHIELQKVLKEEPEHKEASYLTLLSEQELHLEPDSPEVLAAARRVLKLYPAESSEAKKAQLALAKAELQGKLSALEGAFEKKDWKVVGELFGQIPEELEDASIARISFLYHQKQGRATQDSRAYRSLERWLATSPGGIESDKAKEWKSLVDLGMTGSSQQAFERLCEALGKSDSNSGLPGTIKGNDAKDVSKILQQCQSVEVLEAKETEKSSVLKVKLVYQDPYRKKVQSATGSVKLTREQSFWVLDSASPVFGQALGLVGNPKYTVREGWIDNYLPDTLALNDLPSGSDLVEESLEGMIRMLKTKEGVRLITINGLITDLTITSGTLRTKEGLGVGNTIGEFGSAFWVPSYEEIQEMVESGELSIFELLHMKQKGKKNIQAQFIVPVVRKENYSPGQKRRRYLGLVIDAKPQYVNAISEDWKVVGMALGRPRKAPRE